MQTDIVTELPDLVVDRSPELMRGATPADQIAAESLAEYFGLRPASVVLDITADDIAEGRRGEGASCALARALLRLPDVEAVDISGEKPTITRKGQEPAPLGLAGEIAEWIGRFDRGEPVEPIQVKFG